jgi:hypothetical protein
MLLPLSVRLSMQAAHSTAFLKEGELFQSLENLAFVSRL